MDMFFCHLVIFIAISIKNSDMIPL